MPPASLSAKPDTMPGPRTASIAVNRARRPSRRGIVRLADSDTRQSPATGGRSDRVKRIVARDDALEMAVVVDDRHGQQVVAGDHAGDVVLVVEHLDRDRLLDHDVMDAR